MTSKEQPYVGGQAVIEGVMMRAPHCMAIAVRRADGTIVVREDAWISIWERWKFLRWPGFRGGVILAESVYNGMQALNFAADQAVATSADDNTVTTSADDNKAAASAIGEAEPSSAAFEKTSGVRTASDATANDTTVAPEPSSGGNNALTFVASFALAIGLFVGLPHLLAWGTGQVAGTGTDVDSFGFHLVDGIFKLA
ncbi:MAG: DUF1385 domain-containing protein, partial [Myxococcota bacterium]